MKTKSIILSGLLLVSLGAVTTSCEDMLDVDDELHTTNLAPQDTVYQVLGIVNRMQSLADRTILLGELRADLVDLDPTVAKTSLQEIMANNISTDNEYNSIADYYAVINSCNIYLANVDSNKMSHNRKFFEREIQVVKTFRAWTYLELAKIYGRVPFVLEPVLTSGDADDIVASTTNRADMNDICTYFIEDLLPYASKTIELPNYGTISGAMTYDSQKFFIPSRLMLAELYLWRGCYTRNQSDFTEAVRYYYDFITYPNAAITTGTNKVKWSSNRFNATDDSYSSNFTTNDQITYIPMDTCAYDGTWSQLYGMFNSQYENNYYVPIIPSQRIREISREQVNCVYTQINNRIDTTYSTSKIEWEDSLEMGDLRLSAIYNRSAVSNMYTSQYSQDRQHIMKYATTNSDYGPDRKVYKVTLYRNNIVWLHFAEALNRAGFPETAFVILKYGLTNNNMSYVSQTELQNLRQISTYFHGNPSYYDYDDFITIHSSNYSPSQGFNANTQGIHSRGSGDSEYNKYYTLPYDSALWAPVDELEAIRDSLQEAMYNVPHTYVTDSTVRVMTYDSLGNVIGYSTHYYTHIEFESDSDSIAYYDLREQWSDAYDAYSTAAEAAYATAQPIYQEDVAKKILDEEALEGSFEGQRFYDLMRYAMYTGDPDFIANEVAKRKGSNTTDSRADALRGGNWYLPLPAK